MSGKVALVTGANRGIGKEIVKSLAPHFDVVYLTARDGKRGIAARDELGDDKVKFLQLDICDEQSICKVKEFVVKEHGKLDVLVQNAAIAGDRGIKAAQAEAIMRTNFWGSRMILEHFLDVMAPHGRIVLLSSMISQRTLNNFKRAPHVAEELSQNNRSLTVDRLEQLANEFVADFDANKVGWPRSAYGVSKLMVNALARIFGRRAEQLQNGLLVNCCCPGFVATSLSRGNPNAKKTPTEGAQNALYLATLPPGTRLQGIYLSDA